MKPTSHPDLRAAFPAPSRSDWATAATAGTVPVDLAKLRTVLPEGIAIEPLVTAAAVATEPAAPGQGDRRRGPVAGPRTWLIAQPIPAAFPAAWNAAALAALQSGQDALFLHPSTSPTEAGLPLPDVTAWVTALRGLDLAAAPLLLDGPHAGRQTAQDITAALLQLGADPKSARVFLAPDPLGQLAASGPLPGSLDGAWDELAELLGQAPALPAASFLAVSGLPYHQAGADNAKELGLVLAAAADTFRALAARGLPPVTVPGAFRVTLAAGSHLGLTIAKFRAARALWTRFAAALGLPAARRDPFLHAVTAPRGRTFLDAPTNTLRATNEAFGAIAGGADALSLEPWDALLRPSTESAQRLARNTQLILRDECLLGTVADPAGGAWYFERLTEDLAAAAWAFFQQVEAQGGLTAALNSGWLAPILAAAAAEDAKRLRQRRDVLVGVNLYVDSTEVLPPDELTPAAPAPAAPALAASRPAAGYEALRRRVAAWAAQRGRPGRVFLANLGPLRQHQGRADFSRAFFEAAGLEITYPKGFSSPADAAAAAAEVRPDLIVICSTDDTYPELIPAYAAALKAAVPEATLVVAGAPGDREAADRAAGISNWIHLRSDHLNTLVSLLPLA